MVNKFYITGDCHGVFTRFKNLPKEENIGVIVLGDFSINFYLNKNDIRKKKELHTNYPHIIFYCVRGNHEARPQSLPNIEKIFDKNVHGIVYYEPEYPNIRYFVDYGIYTINGYKCGVIGGAYSVDKWYRLARAGVTDKWDYNNPKITGWFPNEQLSEEEMKACTTLFNDQNFDFIFSHTCPYSWRPVDLFLKGVDQSTVDNTMELWMDKLKDKFQWYIWIFGHYHADRLERPHVEMYFDDIENINDIVARWKHYDENGELDWYLVKSPNFDF